MKLDVPVFSGSEAIYRFLDSGVGNAAVVIDDHHTRAAQSFIEELEREERRPMQIDVDVCEVKPLVADRFSGVLNSSGVHGDAGNVLEVLTNVVSGDDVVDAAH